MGGGDARRHIGERNGFHHFIARVTARAVGGSRASKLHNANQRRFGRKPRGGERKDPSKFMVVPLRRGRGRGGAGRRWMARRRSFPRINARRPRVFFRLRFSASCNPDRRAGNFRASNRGTASERGKRSEGKRKMRKRRGGGTLLATRRVLPEVRATKFHRRRRARRIRASGDAIFLDFAVARNIYSRLVLGLLLLHLVMQGITQTGGASLARIFHSFANRWTAWRTWRTRRL